MLLYQVFMGYLQKKQKKTSWSLQQMLLTGYSAVIVISPMNQSVLYEYLNSWKTLDLFSLIF